MRDSWALSHLVAGSLSLLGLAWMTYDAHFLAEGDGTLGASATALVVCGRCLAMVSSLRWVAFYKDVFETFGAVLPSVLAQCVVLYLIMHLFAFVGMLIWGGEVSDVFPEFAGGSKYYSLLNFNSYAAALMTLFQLIVVNNWHVIAGGYYVISGGLCYVYFVAFNILAVSVGVNLMTAFFLNTLLYRFQNKDQFHVWETIKHARLPVPGSPSAKRALKRRASSHAVIRTTEEYQVLNRWEGWDDHKLLVRMFNLEKVDVSSIISALSLLLGGIEIRILSTNNGRRVTVEETAGFARMLKGLGGAEQIVEDIDAQLEGSQEDGRVERVAWSDDSRRCVRIRAAVVQHNPKVLLVLAERADAL